jgi:FAD:protein FMN transferase
VGPVQEFWKFGIDHPSPHDKTAIEQKLFKVGYDTIHLENQTVFLTDQGMQLHLGPIAKGYAEDQAAKKLQKNDTHHAFINAGGDLKTLGSRLDKQTWKTGLQHPRKLESLLASFSLSGKAVATSGDYQKYFNHKGARYHHIFNPKTGYPLTGMTSATVVTDTMMNSDALSTVLFLMGAKKDLAFIDSLKNTESLIVDQNKSPHLSQGMKDLANFSLESFKENLSH